MIDAKIHITWHISPTVPISAREPKVQRADMGPRGLIYHAIWILACIIVFIIDYQAKLTMVNEDKILKYLTTAVFVVTYFFIVTSLICIFCTRVDTDMHFLHGVQIWVIVSPSISRRANSA
jgi:hypothetical protein